MNAMATFIAEKIIDGVQKYTDVFKIKLYQRYQKDVDMILKERGYDNLIGARLDGYGSM